jgi:hypothetical protein
VTTSSTATQGAATADNSILEGLVQECKGRRVDPSDGRLYDFASFRSCYGSDGYGVALDCHRFVWWHRLQFLRPHTGPKLSV